MAAPTFSLIEQVTTGDRVAKFTTDLSGSNRISLEESIATATTDGAISIAFKVAKVIGILINSTKDVTLETNSGGSPANTIALKANIPYVWHNQSYHTFLLTTDVTAFYITNVSGATATITAEVLVDAT